MDINRSLITILHQENKIDVSQAEEYLIEQLKIIHENGELGLGDDYKLTGISLELRVEQLFLNAGFKILQGRDGKEDFVVEPPADSKLKDSIVIEVKSARSPNLKLDNLRQLDDWVFDLSGEEKARKHGLGKGIDPVAIATDGYITSNKKHPTPHKGILVFNGSIGTPFPERGDNILHHNQAEFVKKRNFCVIGINDLINLLSKEMQESWSELHETVGEYKP